MEICLMLLCLSVLPPCAPTTRGEKSRRGRPAGHTIRRRRRRQGKLPAAAATATAVCRSSRTTVTTSAAPLLSPSSSLPPSGGSLIIYLGEGRRRNQINHSHTQMVPISLIHSRLFFLPFLPHRIKGHYIYCFSTQLNRLIRTNRLPNPSMDDHLHIPRLLCCLWKTGIMEPNAGTAIYPLHRCKTIHLVRHAQGVHNVAGEKDHSALMKPDFFDASITPLGWNQVDCLREHVKKSGLTEKIELVICSPLLRTMQTAVGVFGGESYTNGISAPPLMVENAADSGRPAISTFNCPPFLAVEACRERLGVHPCDKRRSITEYRTLFPAIDFSLIENDEDVLWVPDVRETFDSLAERGMKFIDWLWTREEKEIAIVTHSGLLCHTLRMYSKECHPTVRHEVSKYFSNCELRSLVLVDRSMLGSDTPSYNYPGKIPAGLDVPSDVVDEKCHEEGSQERTEPA